ncbi:cytochrome c [uncultured Shimia sp.]|uniref:c-type cytochrome n=1 Tax=uncultured Shimia sp. TaxID=573152 RepID=UPI00261391B2|nr:cytochrome c [uncultured Shimia sp.]
MKWRVILFLAAGVLWACTSTDMPDQIEGERVYEANCEACHGSSGQGDGRLAATMNPAPADLSTLSADNGGAFPVSAVLSKIDGYASDETAQAAMPTFGDLLSGDTVPVETDDGVLTPTPRQLAALLSYLETLQQ